MKADLCIVFLLQICTVLFTFTTGRPQDAELPPTNFPTNNSTYKILNVETVPPIEFPSNTSKYKIVQNSTILKKLSNSSSKIDTEVPDLNIHINHPEDIPQSTVIGENTQSPKSTKYSTTSTSSNIQGPGGDIELIENDVSKTEDSKVNSGKRQSDIHGEHEHKSRNGIPMLQGELAAVLAGVFALIAVVGYIGLLTWRRYLEHRYGNRELLIDEEVYTSHNDMKNFEL